MTTARRVTLPPEAAMALNEIIGIMLDQQIEGAVLQRWNSEVLVELQMKLHSAQDGATITLDISEAALLIDGMAFTEIMSVELPFFEMVVWTSDFVTQELRTHWSEDEWRALAAGS